MGAREDNYIIQLHRQASWPGYLRQIRHHYGDRDVTVTIPPSLWSGLVVAAATSDTATFGALSALSGASDLLVDVGPQGLAMIRQLILDMDQH